MENTSCTQNSNGCSQTFEQCSTSESTSGAYTAVDQWPFPMANKTHTQNSIGTSNPIDQWGTSESSTASYTTVDEWPTSQSTSTSIVTVEHGLSSQSQTGDSDLASQYIIADAWHHISPQESQQALTIADEWAAGKDNHEMDYEADMQPIKAGSSQEPLIFTMGTVQIAYRNALLIEKLVPSRAINDLVFFLANLMRHLEPKLHTLLNGHNGIKYWISIEVIYKNPTENTPFKFVLDTPVGTLLKDFKLKEELKRVSELILMRNANLLKKRTQTTIDTISSASIKVSQFQPLAVSSYQELPQFLANKKCIINVKNNDNRCFGYSILAAIINLDKNGHQTRASKYDEWFHYYGLDSVNYPIQPADISRVEDQLQININLFSFFDDEGKERFPMYVSRKQYIRTIDLLYWKEHYAWLKNFERFLYDVTKHKAKKYVCRRCFAHFPKKDSLHNHSVMCRKPDFINSTESVAPDDTGIKSRNN